MHNTESSTNKLHDGAENAFENLNVKAEASNESEMVKVNDAEIIGDMPQHVLDVPMILGFGRSRDAKAWPAQALTFTDLLSIMTKHPVGTKDGKAFLQGSAVGNIRKKMSIDALYMMGLDIDCGISMDFALAKIAECKLAAILYTTNSHMGTETFVLEGSYNQFCKKNKLSQAGVDRESMVKFLIKERHWLPEIAETIELPEDGATHPEEGKGYNLTHAPMPKFRIILPLDEPFVIAKQTISQAAALDLWRAKLLGLAKTLELPIDISCTDPSRLFYFPRHKQGAPFRTVVMSGEALDFQAIVAVAAKGEKIADDVFKEAAKGLGAGGAAHMVGDFNLRRWAARSAKSFDICKLFRDVAHDKIRNDQGNDKIEVECPFDAFHSNAGDTSDRACWVESANSDFSGRGFGFGCQHNTCKERDRLEFVAEAVSQGWFSVDDLKDERFTTFTYQELETAEVPRNSGHIFDSDNAAIDALNKISAVIQIGSTTRYLVCQKPGQELNFKNKGAAEEWFANWLVPKEDKKTGRIKMIPAFDIWRKSTKRRQFDAIVFRPAGSDDPDAYNIWTGFKLAPKKGDWRLISRHMFEVICDRDPVNFEYTVAWHAQMVQEPEVKPGVALVVYSPQKGSGKSILTMPMRRIFGQHVVMLSQANSLTTNFNGHMEFSLLIVGEEIIWGGDHAAEGPLKTAISEPTVWLEKKFLDGIEIDNYTRFYLVTNNGRGIPAEGGTERRYFAQRARDIHVQDPLYFEPLLAQIKGDGTAAMLDALLSFDIKRVNLRSPPKTAALAAQIRANLKSPPKWWLSILEDGAIFNEEGEPVDGIMDWETKEVVIPRERIFDSYNKAVKTYGMNAETNSVIGEFLGEVVDGLRTKQVKATGKRSYIFPPLAQCRGSFKKVSGVMFADEVAKEATSNEPTPIEAWMAGDADYDYAYDAEAHGRRCQAAGYLLEMDADIEMILGGPFGVETVQWFRELERGEAA